MPKMSHIQLIELGEQPAVSIRTRTVLSELPPLIGESYGKIGAYLAECGRHPSDAPYVAYYNLDMQNLDVEMGFPVASPLPEKGELRSHVLPAGKAVLCMYRGPYSEMAPVYEEMTAWIKKNGYEPMGISYEYYYNDPSFPESEYLTKIILPIKG